MQKIEYLKKMLLLSNIHNNYIFQLLFFINLIYQLIGYKIISFIGERGLCFTIVVTLTTLNNYLRI